MVLRYKYYRTSIFRGKKSITYCLYSYLFVLFTVGLLNSKFESLVLSLCSFAPKPGRLLYLDEMLDSIELEAVRGCNKRGQWQQEVNLFISALWSSLHLITYHGTNRVSGFHHRTRRNETDVLPVVFMCQCTTNKRRKRLSSLQKQDWHKFALCGGQ